MRETSATPHPSTGLARFAAAHHNVIDRGELAMLGFGDEAVRRRVAAGFLRRVHPGVYAVGPALTLRGPYLAAVRSAGRGAVLSHRAAGMLWDPHRYSGATIDVTIPPGNGARTRAGVIVHRSRRPIETTTLDGIPVTTVARTLADLAEVVPLRSLEKALEQADRLNRLHVRAIAAVAAAQPGRRGPALVARLVRTHDTASFTRSELEDACLVFCDDHGIPRPATNARVDGIEVDALWIDRAWSSSSTPGAGTGPASDSAPAGRRPGA